MGHGGWLHRGRKSGRDHVHVWCVFADTQVEVRTQPDGAGWTGYGHEYCKQCRAVAWEWHRQAGPEDNDGGWWNSWRPLVADIMGRVDVSVAPRLLAALSDCHLPRSFSGRR